MSFDIDAIMRMGTTEKQISQQQEPRPSENDRIVQILVTELVPFPAEKHKFKPASPQRMAELVESIRQNGIINALIVRPLPDNGYQILTGHNRRTAAIQLGYRTVPCIIRPLPDDNDAIPIMIADNLNNRELLPSERGWAYRQLVEARIRQNGELEKFSSQNGTKLKTATSIGKEFGDSRNKVYRHIRLTYLIEPLLDLVDAGKIALGTGEQLSYLKARDQKTVYAYCYAGDPTHPLKESQARALREAQADPDQVIDFDLLEALTAKPQKARLRTLKLQMSTLREYFPSGTPEEVVLQTIHTALAVYFGGKEE